MEIPDPYRPRGDVRDGSRELAANNDYSERETMRISLVLLIASLLIGDSSCAKRTMSLEAFGQLYLGQLRKAVPNAEFDLRSSKDQGYFIYCSYNGATHSIFIDNAYRTYVDKPGDINAILEDYCNVVTKTILAKDAVVSLGIILPALRHHTYATDYNLWQRPFVGDLVVCLSVTKDSSITLLTPEDVDSLHSIDSAIMDSACSNFRRDYSIPEPVESAGLFEIRDQGALQSSWLMLPEMWDAMRAKIHGDIVVALPSRDVLLFAATDSKTSLDRLRAVVRGTRDRNPYALSQCLFMVGGAGVKVLEDLSDKP